MSDSADEVSGAGKVPGCGQVDDGTWPPPRPGGHVQMLLGAYVLGGLSPGDEHAVRVHLDQCARCRAEHQELASVPGWLDLLEDDDGSAEYPAGEPVDRGEGGTPER